MPPCAATRHSDGCHTFYIQHPILFRPCQDNLAGHESVRMSVTLESERKGLSTPETNWQKKMMGRIETMHCFLWDCPHWICNSSHNSFMNQKNSFCGRIHTKLFAQFVDEYTLSSHTVVWSWHENTVASCFHSLQWLGIVQLLLHCG